MNERNELLSEIRQCKRKYNIAQMLDVCTCFIACGGLLATLLEVISVFFPFYWVHVFAGIAIGCAILAGILYAFVKRIGMHDAARYMDAFGLKERMQTAYEQMEEESSFAVWQRQDALRSLNANRAKIRISVIPDRRHLLAAGLSLVLTVGLAFVPSSARSVAQERHVVGQEAKEQEKKLSELTDAIDQIDVNDLTEEQKALLAQLQKELESSRQELSRADSSEALEAAKRKLAYKYAQASQSLKKLADQVADANANGIANAGKVADQAAGDGKQQMANGQGTNDDGQGTGKDDASGGNGDGNGNDSGQGGTDGNGDSGADSGIGDGNGNGTSGDNSGQGGSGSNGSGNGSDPGNGSGGNGRGEGSGGGTHDYVSVPNAAGNDENLTGNQTGNEVGDQYRAQNGLAWEGDHVSLDSVVSSYTKNAYEGLSSGRYPSGMEDVIKDYFKNLSE